MILAEVKNREIDLHQDADDALILSCMQKQKKQLEDTLPLFEQGGRTDLVNAYQDQMAVLSDYLPKQLGVEELREQLSLFLAAPEMLSLPEVAVIGRAIGRFKDVADTTTIKELVEALRHK
ncbi:MAG: Yqey-like protein [Microgenomates bacterium OLB22]|nr:MAG: Yqey-like protein [Microgenomates bacterium OLB22]